MRILILVLFYLVIATDAFRNVNSSRRLMTQIRCCIGCTTVGENLVEGDAETTAKDTEVCCFKCFQNEKPPQPPKPPAQPPTNINRFGSLFRSWIGKRAAPVPEK